ncbi:MAG: 4Fe-4S binding protein [Planctomycetota bacterium]
MGARAAGVLVLTFAAVLLAPAAARGAERFPQPEFESGYRMPSTTTPAPAPRAAIRQYADAVALAAALGLTAWLALRKRSRRGIFALMIACLVWFGFWKRGCVCPVGSIQNVALAAFDSGYALPALVLVFFLLPLVAALFFGRVFCAAACPLGGVQDLVVVKPVKVPRWLEQALGLLAVLYLGLAVLMAATGADFIVCRYDPFVSIFRLSGGAFPVFLGAALLALGVFVARPYCRFLCPYGVLLGWASRLSKWHVTVTPDECVQCRLCEEACPFEAIRAPVAAEDPEPRSRGVRRLALLLGLLPALAALGLLLGAWLSPTLSRAHPTVSLAEQVAREDAGLAAATTPESDAFRQSDETADELRARAGGVRRRFAVGAPILGVLLGLAIGLKLIGLSIRRTRTDYEPDRGACLSCARCFSSCPRERMRKTGKPAPAPAPAAGAPPDATEDATC